MGWQVITPPELEPVTLDEVKPNLGLDLELYDDDVEDLIRTAREYVEEKCNRGIVTQTLELVLDGFPSSCQLPVLNRLPSKWPPDQYIELPRGNLVSVESVKYRDGAGVEQTWATSEYLVNNVDVPGRVLLAPEKSWPATQRRFDAVRIRYVVGFEVDKVPAKVKQAIQLLVKHMWENDTPEVTGTIVSAVRFSFENLIAGFRIITL